MKNKRGETMIRCNECNKLFHNEDELQLLELEEPMTDKREFVKACPACKTDVYLMDI
jgi:hypothetical protein